MIGTSRASLAAMVVRAAAVTVGIVIAFPSIAVAHGPDPLVGGTKWAANQAVAYDWLSGAAPPSVMKPAIDAAAADVSSSKLSKAATFSRVTGATSWINYGSSICGDTVGLACFTRSHAPSYFTMSFRTQGYQFTWGQMDWCQFHGTVTSSWPSGCYDTEMATVDEFGHVEILGHHVNFSDGSDYLEAAVQALSHAKPGVGWFGHTLQECDQATLQEQYDLSSASTAVADCFGAGLTTTTTMAASATSFCLGQSVTLSGSLHIATNAGYLALSGDALSRTISIDRSAVGANAFSSYQTTTSGSTGSYSTNLGFSTNVSYDFRARYAGGGGANGDASPTITIRWGSAC